MDGWSGVALGSILTFCGLAAFGCSADTARIGSNRAFEAAAAVREQDGDECTSDCVLPTCGNAELEPPRRCGDGRIQGGEGCDDGNRLTEDACPIARKPPAATASVWLGVEACDEG